MWVSSCVKVACSCRELKKLTYMFFIYSTSFNSVSVLLTFSWIELQMLLRCYLIHLTVIIFVFTLFVYISRPRSIYVGSMWFFICISIFIMISFIISLEHTNLFFCLFFGWYRRWIMWVIFQWLKFSLKVLLSICFIFCQFQLGVAYEKQSKLHVMLK